MPNVIELGQRVKAKYPGQYDDLPDLELGRKVKAKYAEYADFEDVADENPAPEQQSALSKVADVANAHVIQSLGGGTFSDVYDAAGEGLKQVTEKALGEKYAVTRQKLPFLKGVEFAGQVARAVPETMDAMLTPFGAATTALLGAAGPKVKALAGAAFSTAQAKELPQRAKEAIADPTPETVGNVFKDTAMTAAPAIPAFSRKKSSTVSKAQAEMATMPEEQPIKLPWAQKAAKSAEESAMVFDAQARLTPDSATGKSAAESAEVFTKSPKAMRGKPRDVRRAASMPPEEGVPEQLDRFSDEVSSKPYTALDADEKRIVDDLWMERRRQTQGGSFAAQGKPITPPLKPVEEQYFNFNRVRISPEEENLIRQRLRDMDAAGEVAKDVEPHAAIIAEAKNIDPSLVREVSNESGIRGRAARQVMRERINFLAREISAADEQLRGKTPEEAEAINATRQRMENDLNSYLKEFAGIRTEAGRNLAALKIVARNTLDIDWWLNEAKRSAKLPSKADLPEAKAKLVRELVVKAQDAQASGDAAAAEAAKSNLAREVAKMRENGPLETVAALWRSGLLTAPITHAINMTGNAQLVALEEAARLPAWLVDLGWSLKSKQRKVAPPNPMAVYRAMKESATRGVREAKQVITQGGTTADMAKGELAGEWNYQGLRNLAEKSDDQLARKVLGTSNDLINGYINTVNRTLGAEDRIAKVYAIRRGIEAQARIKALNEMKAGIIPQRELVRRSVQLVENPTEAMTAEAIAYADFVTFNSENVASNAVGRMASAFGPIGKAGLTFVLPFRRTVFNVFNRTMDYTPFGAAMRPALEYYTAKYKGKPPVDLQKIVAESVGRGSIGTALLAIGWVLGSDDKATGTGNEDPSKRKVQQAAGRMTGAIRSPFDATEWWRTARLAPGGTLMQIGAQLARESSKNLKNEVKRPWNVAAVGGKALSEHPMLQGVEDVKEFISNPQSRGTTFIASKAGSFVPSAVNSVAVAIDPSPREFVPPAGSGPIDAAVHGVKSRIPFLRGTLPPAVNVFGHIVEGRASNAINPFTPTKAKEETDPMYRELIDLDIGFSGPKPQPGETEPEFRERKILAGAVAERAVRDLLAEAPEDKDERRDALRKAIIRAESQLTRYIKSEEFQSMSPQERIQEMRELTATYR